MIVEKWIDDGLYRGEHPLYGQVAGYFNDAGNFVAHRTGSGGSFFERDVWATDGFVIPSVVVVDED